MFDSCSYVGNVQSDKFNEFIRTTLLLQPPQRLCIIYLQEARVSETALPAFLYVLCTHNDSSVWIILKCGYPLKSPGELFKTPDVLYAPIPITPRSLGRGSSIIFLKKITWWGAR